MILLNQEWSVLVDGIWLINLDGEITLRKISELLLDDYESLMMIRSLNAMLMI